MPRIQENRDLAFDSPLGVDALMIRTLHLSEQLGRPFHAELELTSEDFDVDFSKIVGQNVTIKYTGGAAPRFLNGIVSRFGQGTALERLASYTATVVPFLWFLTRTADCRIFQNKTVPDIIQEVLSDKGYTDLSNKLTGTYGPWEYCVQYRETDFNFISRLMEQEGIYYYFMHDNGKHTMVLIDDPNTHVPNKNYETIAFRTAGEDSNREYIREWVVEQELQAGAFALNDYDFKAPRKSLRAVSQVPREHVESTFEIYDYPGEYIDPGDGTEYSKIRIQELAAQFEIIRGSSDAAGVTCGYTFTLADYPRAEQNREVLVTSATYIFTSDKGDSSGGAGTEPFNCHFTAIDAKTQFRPPRLTPKPAVQGPQTAVVVGPSGQEIHTDEFGRVRVQFFWDRHGTSDEKSSCFIRVGQVWAGNKWGGIFIPRIGQEVIVEFLEGDPDQPIITGRVYNGINKPPYDLPANKTISGIKSNSSPGGSGFNEIRLEDKKGSEQIFIHGEKNQDIRIKNDCFEWIGNDRHLIVKNMQIEHVEVDRHETIDRDHQEHIGRDRHTIVDGKEAKSVGTTLSLKVGGNVAEVFSASHSEQVSNDYYLKADNIVIEALTNVTIKVGQSYIAIESGGILIGTTGTIELKSTGQTSMEADGGISAKGMTVSVKADASLSMEGTVQAELKGPMVSVQADAMLTLKGGMVMIN